MRLGCSAARSARGRAALPAHRTGEEIGHAGDALRDARRGKRAQRWIALRAALDCVARSACGVPKGNLAMCEVRC